VVKTGTGTLSLSGVNTYTGTTTVSNGVLAVVYNGSTDGSINNSVTINVLPGAVLDGSGRSDGTFQLGSSATQLLEGRGSINGNLNVNGSGTVSPGGGKGGSTGTLTVTNNVSLAGTAWMKLKRANSPNSDRIVSTTGNITYGGTLLVTNVGAALQPGDTFTLFSGGGLSGGTFSTIILPNYITWDTSQLGVNGSISVVAILPPPAFSAVDFSDLVNGNVFITVTNGQPGGAVNVLTSTNISLPFSSWTLNAQTAFDGNGEITHFPISLDNTLPQQYMILQAPQ
jgi:autotransporter-associated beta strand protein